MKILVVEDEKEIRELLKKTLEAECFAVDEAEDGELGLKMAQVNYYDLIILDNMMPKKDGLEVCRELRLDGKAVPILMLSVKSEAITKSILLNTGADDYMTKPYSVDELIARIRALLRRPKVINSEILKISDLEIDVKRQVVKRAGQEIYLTRKEFMLLEFLLRNRGEVQSRGVIMEHVWDMNADPFSNTIESHVLSLRKKIDTDKKNKIISTVPGRGYKIE